MDEKKKDVNEKQKNSDEEWRSMLESPKSEDVPAIKEASKEVSEEVREESTPVPSTPAPTPTETKQKRYPEWLYYVIAVVVFATAVYFLTESNRQQPAGLGDDVVATVDGAKISRSDFDERVALITQNATLQGADVNDETIQSQIEQQAIDTLINTVLLKQGAKEAGITADEGEVDAQYVLLVEQSGGEEELLARVDELGMDEDELRRNIEDELAIQAFIDSQIQPEEVIVTDEEIEALYEQLVAGQEVVPLLENVRPQIKEQIRLSKQQEMITNFLLQLRENANIEVAI